MLVMKILTILICISAMYRDFETPILTTGGAFTAIYQFMQGDIFNFILGTVVTLSVVVLNVVKIFIHLKKLKENEKDK